MERFDADGTLRPTSPSESAEADQQLAQFRNLTEGLVLLHRRATVLVISSSTLAKEMIPHIQAELHEKLKEAFITGEVAQMDRVFSYIMYLIDQVNMYQVLRGNTAGALNSIRSLINELIHDLAAEKGLGDAQNTIR